MKIRSFRYYFREAFHSIARNRLMSVASIATVFSCVFIVIVFMVLIINIDDTLKYLEDSVGISVFIDDTANAEQVNSMYVMIAGMEFVSHIEYISWEEAHRRFMAGLDDEDSSVLSGLDSRIFPRSFDLKVENPAYQPEIIRQLEYMMNNGAGISSIRHDQSVVDMLLVISRGIRIICGFLITLLTVNCFIIIVNTIKITVNARKAEISIMKYIGATDWFVRWPFIIEGLLIGLLGSVLPIIICWFGYDEIINVFYRNFPILQGIIVFKLGFEIFTLIVPVSLALGAAIGVIGSLSSIRKHLDV